MKKQAFNPYLPSWEYIPDGEPQMEMEDYIRTADKMMYRIKQERKRDRR